MSARIEPVTNEAARELFTPEELSMPVEWLIAAGRIRMVSRVDLAAELGVPVEQVVEDQLAIGGALVMVTQEGEPPRHLRPLP
jgi:hypothetical protein